ncbi:MAG: carbamoyl-phosphate synthase large subunit [Geminicoccaceae bacterium]
MPRRDDLSSILVIGAGPIVIGQACEFDYSGTQAIKALKDEGYRVVLINSNPATIMTDPNMVDATYVEPITPEVVAKIIAKERPDACLATMGGQTALNVAKRLAEDGTFDRAGVELIGANREAIDKAEDRDLFRQAMARIDLAMPKSVRVRNLNEAREALEVTGLPAIIRPSFTLGGTGGGIAYNQSEFEEIAASGLDASPISEIAVEESVLGWKEFEMEVIRDRADNCIIVCSIENVDPMGVHTGDSVTVAPALTLTDREYQRMRNASIAVLREIGVETGGSNVQFAINPADGRMVVIEMNPRVSRSSALASKATGFPIAKIAAKLAVGYTLDELDNDITGMTPASFEPVIDYVVTKIPRFAFEKFPEADPVLTTQMKSVGEAMAIGQTFAESLQKALRSLETGLDGFNPWPVDAGDEPDARKEALLAALGRPLPERLLVVAEAFRAGLTIEAVFGATSIDPWFLSEIRDLMVVEAEIQTRGLPHDAAGLARLKSLGFSDARLASIAGLSAAEVAERRQALGVKPIYRRIDTCAGEFPSPTPYLYGVYEAGTTADGKLACEARPTNRRKVLILGGGPNRIGQGIEFDYCCVQAVLALREAGFETIMINCNPETVSTDYDTADRLYFEPMADEDVVAVCLREANAGELVGAIVQLGGQTPLKLVNALVANGITILGTPPDALDLAEDRERFKALLHEHDLQQPANAICDASADLAAAAGALGYPLVMRPSFVLGGRAMRIVHNAGDVAAFEADLDHDTKGGPILLDRYLENAIEVDVDVLADGERVEVAGIMEHIEQAGIHSGDSACSLPAYSLSPPVLDDIRRHADILARSLGVRGLMNLQLAVKDDRVYVLEVNPRASRTVPFVAKAIGRPLAKIAARIMVGERLGDIWQAPPEAPHVAVKEAVFPFARFPKVDLLLGPEMKSTGEVMGLDRDFGMAFAKSQIAAGAALPKAGAVFVSVRDADKNAAVACGQRLIGLGFSLIATRGTAAALKASGLEVETVKKVFEGRPHIVDLLTDGKVSMVINTTEGGQAIKDSFSLRRAALTAQVPYYTTVAGANAAVQAIEALARSSLDVTPLQSYAASLH